MQKKCYNFYKVKGRFIKTSEFFYQLHLINHLTMLGNGRIVSVAVSRVTRFIRPF